MSADIDLDALIIRRILGDGAVRYLLRCVRVAEEVTGRRDGIAPPTSAKPLRALLIAACGNAAMPVVGDVPASVLIDPITTEEVARVLGCKVRRARQMCAGGAFGTASDSTGRWLVERDDVLALAKDRGIEVSA